MIYRAAEEAVDLGKRRLHLGGGVGGSSDDGLYHFKRGLGSVEHTFSTWHFIADAQAYGQVARENTELQVSSSLSAICLSH